MSTANDEVSLTENIHRGLKVFMWDGELDNVVQDGNMLIITNSEGKQFEIIVQPYQEEEDDQNALKKLNGV